MGSTNLEIFKDLTGYVVDPVAITVKEEDTDGNTWDGPSKMELVISGTTDVAYSSIGPPDHAWRNPSTHTKIITLNAGTTYDIAWGYANPPSTTDQYYSECRVYFSDANGNSLLELSSSNDAVAPTGPAGETSITIPLSLSSGPNPLPVATYDAAIHGACNFSNVADVTGSVTAKAAFGDIVKFMIPMDVDKLPTMTGDVINSSIDTIIKASTELIDNNTPKVEVTVATKMFAVGDITVTYSTGEVLTVTVSEAAPGQTSTSTIQKVERKGLEAASSGFGSKIAIDATYSEGDVGKQIKSYLLVPFETNVFAYANKPLVLDPKYDTGFSIKLTHEGTDYWVLNQDAPYWSSRGAMVAPTTAGIHLGLEKHIARMTTNLLNPSGLYAFAVNGPDFKSSGGVVEYQGTLTVVDGAGTFEGTPPTIAEIRLADGEAGNKIIKTVKVTKGQREDGTACYLYDGVADVDTSFDDELLRETYGSDAHMMMDLTDTSLIGTRMRFSPYENGHVPAPPDTQPIILTVKGIEDGKYSFSSPSGKTIEDIDQYIYTRGRTYRFICTDSSIASHPLQILDSSNVAVSQAIVTSASSDSISGIGEYIDFKVGGMDDVDAQFVCQNHTEMRSSAFVFTHKMEYGVTRIPIDIAQTNYQGKDIDADNTGAFDALDSWKNQSLDGGIRYVLFKLGSRMLPKTYMYDALSNDTSMGGTISMTNRGDVSIVKPVVTTDNIKLEVSHTGPSTLGDATNSLRIDIMKITKTRTPIISSSNYADGEKYFAFENPEDGQMYYVTGSMTSLGDLFGAGSLVTPDDASSMVVNINPEKYGLVPGDYVIMLDHPWYSAGYATFGSYGEANEAVMGEPGNLGNNATVVSVTADDLSWSDLVDEPLVDDMSVESATVVDERYLDIKLRSRGVHGAYGGKRWFGFMKVTDVEPPAGTVSRHCKFGPKSEDGLYTFDYTEEDGSVVKYYLLESWHEYGYYSNKDKANYEYVAQGHLSAHSVRIDLLNQTEPIKLVDHRFSSEPSLGGFRPNAKYMVVTNFDAAYGVGGLNSKKGETNPVTVDTATFTLDLKNNAKMFKMPGASIPEGATSIYIGTDSFVTDASEVGSKPITGLPNFDDISYSVTHTSNGSELVNLLNKVRIAISVDEFDDFADAEGADRVDQIRTYQKTAGKSLDLNELSDIGLNTADLSGFFSKSAGADDVVVNGTSIAIDIANKDPKVASAVPKALGASMPLVRGKDELLRVMINEADFAELAAFSVKGVGATDRAGNAGVTLQSLLGSASSNVGDTTVFSDANTDATASVSDRLIGHEILSALFRAFPAGHDNTNQASGTIWKHEDEDFLTLKKLPNSVNLQFVLRTELNLKDADGTVLLSTKPTPPTHTAFDSGTELPADSSRVLILYNFVFSV